MIATQTQELQQEWQTETAVEQPQDREDKIRGLLYLVQHIAGRVVDKLAQKLGRQPDTEEIRKELGMTPEAFEAFQERTQTIPSFSLNEAWADEDGNSVDRSESMANPNAPTALDEMLREEDRAILREELNRLPKNERIVLCLYYMEDLRLKEIALILEVSESRVSQIHTEALRKITAAMRKAHAA
jgi:RNA polymerase sigma factor for flagellar operon FliA